MKSYKYLMCLTMVISSVHISMGQPQYEYFEIETRADESLSSGGIGLIGDRIRISGHQRISSSDNRPFIIDYNLNGGILESKRLAGLSGWGAICPDMAINKENTYLCLYTSSSIGITALSGDSLKYHIEFPTFSSPLLHYSKIEVVNDNVYLATTRQDTSWLIRISSQGLIAWSKKWIGNINELHIDSSEHIILAGTNDQKLWATKLDTNGNEVFSKVYFKSGITNRAVNIVDDHNSYTISTSYIDTTSSLLSNAIFTIDSLGQFEFGKHYSDSGIIGLGYPGRIIQVPDGYMMDCPTIGKVFKYDNKLIRTWSVPLLGFSSDHIVKYNDSILFSAKYIFNSHLKLIQFKTDGSHCQELELKIDSGVVFNFSTTNLSPGVFVSINYVVRSLQIEDFDVTSKMVCNNFPLTNPDINKSGDILVYPNPVSDEMNIMNLSISTSKIDLINTNGQILLSINHISNENEILNVKHLDPGIYYVRFSGDTNTYYKKVIVVK